METFNQPSSRVSWRGWLTLFLAIAVALAAAVVPLVLVVAPALWAYAGARTKPVLLLLPALAYAALMFTQDSVFVAAGLSGAALLAAALLYVLLTNRFGNADTALLTSGLFLAGLYVAICLPGVWEGRGAVADIQASIASLKSFYASAAAQMPQLGSEGVKAVLSTMDMMYEAVPTSFVAVLCIFSSVLGLGNLLFFRAFCHKHKEIAISPMRPFREWTLPRSMTIGLFVMLIGSLILEFTSWAYAASFSVTVNILLAIPLFLQGVSVVDFFIARSQKNVATIRTLTYIAFGVLYQLVLFPLVLVGCFDQIFRVRDRMRGAPPRAA